jgi:hypothetical protein
MSLLKSATKRDVVTVVCRALRDALSNVDAFDVWMSLKEQLPRRQWIYFGRILGALGFVERDALKGIFADCGPPIVFELALAKRFDFLQWDRDAFAGSVELALRGSGTLLQTLGPSQAELAYLSFFGLALDSENYQSLFRNSPRIKTWIDNGVPFREVLVFRRRGNAWNFASSESLRGQVDESLLNKCDQFLAIFSQLSDLKAAVWRTSLRPWSELVEGGIAIFGLRPSFFDIALVAANVGSKTELGQIGQGLFDQSVPLCERIRYAKLKSGSASWWKMQLEAASNQDQRYFALTVLLVCCAPRLILSISEIISPMLDQLPSKYWDRIHGRVERLDRLERFAIRQPLRTALAKCGERLSVIIGLRLPAELASEIVKIKLTRYRGNDRRILRFQLDQMLAAVFRKPSKWRSALPIIRHAYAKDITALMGPFLNQSGPEEHGKIPLAVAKAICSNAGEYPLGVIEAAQTQLAKHAGSRAKPPGAIARLEGWFD